MELIHILGSKRRHLHKTRYNKNIYENLALPYAFQNIDLFWLPCIEFIEHLPKEGKDKPNHMTMFSIGKHNIIYLLLTVPLAIWPQASKEYKYMLHIGKKNLT